MPTIPEMVHEVLGALFSYDGKLWRTLKLLLTQPGELTVRYEAGQRASFLGPLQMFLWLQAITFAAHSAFFDSDQFRTNHKSAALLGLGIWLAVIFFTLGKRNLAHALVCASHTWSFLMVILLGEYLLAVPIANRLISAGVLRGQVPVGTTVTIVAMIWMSVYLVMTVRKVYGSSVPRVIGIYLGLLAGFVVAGKWL